MRSPILLDDYPYYQDLAHPSLLSRKSSRGWARTSLIRDVRSVFIATAVLGPLGNIDVRYCMLKNAFFFINNLDSPRRGNCLWQLAVNSNSGT